MCFSATASFAVAGASGLAGAFTISRAKKLREVPLAAIPLVFAAQQAIEGSLAFAGKRRSSEPRFGACKRICADCTRNLATSRAAGRVTGGARKPAARGAGSSPDTGDLGGLFRNLQHRRSSLRRLRRRPHTILCQRQSLSAGRQDTCEHVRQPFVKNLMTVIHMLCSWSCVALSPVEGL